MALAFTQMSLAFVNMQPFVDSNIIGATKMDQLKENIDSIHLELSEEVINDINAIHENKPFSRTINKMTIGQKTIKEDFLKNLTLKNYRQSFAFTSQVAMLSEKKSPSHNYFWIMEK